MQHLSSFPAPAGGRGLRVAARLPAVRTAAADHAPAAARNNTFQTLATGLFVNISENRTSEVRGNQFIDCQRGVEASTRPDNRGAAPVLYTTCNTFQRKASRNGTAYGYFLQDGSGPYFPPLVFDDFTRPRTGVILKDLFAPGGRPPGDYWAIWNQSSNPVKYLTFNVQGNTTSGTYLPYGGGTSPVNFSGGGNLIANPGPLDNANFFPCRLVGFPDTGIQQRAAPAPVTGPGATLAQNVPNPCSGSTSIDFKLPAKTSRAAVVIRRGLDGTEVLQVPLKGQATQCELDIRTLPAGLYFYTLLADGIPVQTKRLFIQ